MVIASSISSPGGPCVAVLGAGLLGCSLAFELARRGCRVDLFDRAATPVTGAGYVNEGKLHLGYLWAKDPSLETGLLLAEGSLRFLGLLRRWLGASTDDLSIGSPYIYAVPRESMISPGTALGYMDHMDAAVRSLTADLLASGEDDRDIRRAVAARELAPLSAGELESLFDPNRIAAAARTPEIAVDPREIATRFRAAIAAEANIAFRPGELVERVEQGDAGCEVVANGRAAGRYDATINALWDGRLAVDAASGLPPRAPWRWRTKYSLRAPVSLLDYGLDSVTMLLGPFGDLVDFRNGTSHLSWYPAGLMGIDDGIEPPAAWREPSPARLASIRRETVAALAERCPGVARIPASAIEAAQITGGPIFAAGESDIDDPASGLHGRTRIGIRSLGRHHSVDPGKYCLAPMMAMRAADLIVER